MSEKPRRELTEETQTVSVDTPTSIIIYLIAGVLIMLTVMYIIANPIGIGEIYLDQWTMIFTYVSLITVFIGLSQKHLKQIKVLHGLLDDEPNGYLDMWTLASIIVPSLVFLIVYRYTSPYFDLIGEYVLPIGITVVVVLLWEYIEHLMAKKLKVGKDQFAESKKNKLTDILMSVISCLIALFVLGKFGFVI